MAARKKAPAQAGAGRVSTEPEYVRERAPLPEPECPADLEILEGLALLDPMRASRYWYARQDRYDWRAAQLASWTVPIGSCSRCRQTVHWACWRWRNNGHCPYGCDDATRRI